MIRPLFLTLTRSRWATRLLLGLDLPQLPPGAHYFDVTTLALARFAGNRVSAGSRVLDVGTGSAAVLSCYLWRRGCRVVATELDERIAEQAERCLRHQGARVELRRGPLFAGFDEELDFVLFNPPYVPSSAGVDRGRTEAYRSQWDGGPDGTRAMAAFLDELPTLAGTPTAILGVHRAHVLRERVEALFAERPGLQLEAVERVGFLPVDLYVFSSRKSPIASTSRPDE